MVNPDAIWAHIIDTDGNWGTSKFKRASLRSVVSHIHFVAHENEGNVGDGGLPPTNHWSAFLAIYNDAASIRMEAAPNDPGELGMIILEDNLKKDQFTTENTFVASVPFPAGTTVADILHLAIQNKRDKYTFSPVGEGCRFWMYTLAQDLADASLISAKEAEAVRTAIPHYYPTPKGTAPIARPMAEGSFF